MVTGQKKKINHGRTMTLMLLMHSTKLKSNGYLLGVKETSVPWLLTGSRCGLPRQMNVIQRIRKRDHKLRYMYTTKEK
jgi:hypothetical protein